MPSTDKAEAPVAISAYDARLTKARDLVITHISSTFTEHDDGGRNYEENVQYSSYEYPNATNSGRRTDLAEVLPFYAWVAGIAWAILSAIVVGLVPALDGGHFWVALGVVAAALTIATAALEGWRGRQFFYPHLRMTRRLQEAYRDVRGEAQQLAERNSAVVDVVMDIEVAHAGFQQLLRAIDEHHVNVTRSKSWVVNENREQMISAFYALEGEAISALATVMVALWAIQDRTDTTVGGGTKSEVERTAHLEAMRAALPDEQMRQALARLAAASQ